jgi:hypothetical protein
MAMNPKEQLMARAVDPKYYPIDPENPNWTKPRTYGTFSIPDEFVYHKKHRKYRCGNYPLRLIDLERDYGKVELIAVFENRDDAEALAELENG